MRKWKEEACEIRYIFEDALRDHASYMNNKSAPIPEGSRSEVENSLRRLGYRLVIRSIEHDASACAGEKLAVNVAWENVGVAPPYRDYRVALRVTKRGFGTSKPHIVITEKSIRGWLPGVHQTELSLSIPDFTRAGKSLSPLL